MSTAAQKNEFQQAPEEYKEIGKLLRSAREQMRYSLDQASRLLHIRVRYLEALEQGRLGELPGLTYTKGYLQSYAMFLGLDKDEILRRFDEMEATLARKNFYFPQVFSKEKTPNRLMVWGSLGVALFTYVAWSLSSRSDLPRLSQVEKLPEAPKTVHLSEGLVRDVSCLREPDVLYPTCTMVATYVFNLTPTQGHHITVMDFGGKDDALPVQAAPVKNKPVAQEQEPEEDEADTEEKPQ